MQIVHIKKDNEPKHTILACHVALRSANIFFFNMIKREQSNDYWKKV